LSDSYNNDASIKAYRQEPGKNYGFKYCENCGEPIVLKLFELYEVQNHNSWMHWKRLKVKHWWTAFEADSPNEKHVCNKQQEKQTKNLNHGVAA
jgi:hypothetical protein